MPRKLLPRPAWVGTLMTFNDYYFHFLKIVIVKTSMKKNNPSWPGQEEIGINLNTGIKKCVKNCVLKLDINPIFVIVFFYNWNNLFYNNVNDKYYYY